MSDEERPPSTAGPSTPAHPVRTGRFIVGALLVGAGAAWLAEATGALAIPWDTVLPSALILVGLGLAWLGLRGRSSGGLVVIGVALTLLLAVGTGVRIPFEGGVGERLERPASASALEDEYELAVGSLTLDLTGLPDPEGAALSDERIEVSVGVGQLVVLLPGGWRGTAHATAGIGEVRLLGERRSGFGAEARYVQGGPAPSEPLPVSLELSVGIGQIEVRRA